MRRAIAAAAVALATTLAAAGCGGSGQGLVVSAATSLKVPFEHYAGRLHPAVTRLSFAGSDLLAAQIQRGVRPDVFASANLKLPDALHAQGLVETPVVFASNRLVLAVPAGSAKVRSLADLTRPGVTIAVGAPAVPIGTYTRQVLGRLGATSAPILAHVRSEEPDVGGIVGKLAQGAVDAGFVYVTDVAASHGALRAIELPARLQPRVAYGVAVVRGTRHAAAARRFIAGLLSGPGQRELRAAGFGPPR